MPRYQAELSWQENWALMLPLFKAMPAIHINTCPRPLFLTIRMKQVDFTVSHCMIDSRTFGGGSSLSPKAIPRMFWAQAATSELVFPVPGWHLTKSTAWITLLPAVHVPGHWLRLQSWYSAAMPCDVWPATCPLLCLIKQLAKSDSKFKNTLTWQRAEAGHQEWWNILNKPPQGLWWHMTYKDPPPEEKCLNIQIYYPEYNVFQEILSCLPPLRYIF